jgi:hypothetical protein
MCVCVCLCLCVRVRVRACVRARAYAGETLQVDFSDGSKGYLEQTCHHPPITSFKLDGPQSLYEYWSEKKK